MIKDLEKHIISDKPDIAWRFEDKEYVLRKIRVLDREAENLIWDLLKTEKFLLPYELNKDKFKNFETIEFADNYESVTIRLREILETDEEIILTWASDGHSLLTDSMTFIDNWDDFFYPSSDDLIVINCSKDWIIYIAHFESFQFGQGIKTK